MSFRLRHGQHHLEVPIGEFAVGRSTACQLSVDDPLVSRRHALFRVEGGRISVEDLQSRNGVIVNERRITGRAFLTPGDRVRIGDQELVVEELLAAAPAGSHHMKSTLSGSYSLPPTEDGERVAPTTESPSMLKRIDAFAVLGGVAEKALALGHTADAERILASPLAELIEASRAGRVVASPLVDQAARMSARLATATGKGTWADYVIELYAQQRRLCPGPVIDELYNAMRRVTSVDVSLLRGYVAAMRANGHLFGPAERFLFQRLEGLERLAVLR